jgi:hypothetical protein
MELSRNRLQTSQLLRVLALLAALLVAQWGAFSHAVEHELHPTDDAPCFICVAANFLGHGAIAAAVAFTFAAGQHTPYSPPLLGLPAGPILTGFRARAPPAL